VHLATTVGATRTASFGDKVVHMVFSAIVDNAGVVEVEVTRSGILIRGLIQLAYWRIFCAPSPLPPRGKPDRRAFLAAFPKDAKDADSPMPLDSAIAFCRTLRMKRELVESIVKVAAAIAKPGGVARYSTCGLCYVSIYRSMDRISAHILNCPCVDNNARYEALFGFHEYFEHNTFYLREEDYLEHLSYH
jgi:hypothetical protein